MIQRTCLLFCNCSGGALNSETRRAVSMLLPEVGVDTYELNDLCALVLSDRAVLRELDSKYDKKLLIACYPRAIRNLFTQNNITFHDYEVLNLRDLSINTLHEHLSQVEKDNSPKYFRIDSELKQPAWYPVIDSSRCTCCGQCARFCLFGVYRFSSKDGLSVVNPLSCKNNCPACGRTCPSNAIIFPRLSESSVLSGAELTAKTRSQENTSLLARIEERNRQRKHIFNRDMLKIAEEERRQAIEEFKHLNKS